MSENNLQTFNPEQFLNLSYNEANSTELLPVPDGDYIATSDPVNDKSFILFDYKSGDKAGQKGLMVVIQWNVNDEGGVIKEAIGRTPVVRQSITLDIRSDGTIEFGKGRNVELGRVREALKQNGNGEPWAFSMLGGKTAKISVKTTISTKDQKSYTNVTKVAAL